MTLHRRDLIKTVAAGAGAAAATTTLGGLGSPAGAHPSQELDDARAASRSRTGRELRRKAGIADYPSRLPAQPDNGEEDDWGYVAGYSKGLPHNELGEPDDAAYELMLRAARTGDPADFERIPVGMPGARKHLGPQGGLAHDLMSTDTFATVVPPAPRWDSPEGAAEMAELYWMALLRDVPFAEFETSPLAAEAAADLSRYEDYRAPKEDGSVTPRVLFRSGLPGDIGPYVSQFLHKTVQFGTNRIYQLNDTVQPGLDFATGFDEWLALQNGAPRRTTRNFDDTRYLQSPRDLGHWTHFDALQQAYLFACSIMLESPAYPAQLQDPGNPYFRSVNQVGFHTFGSPHIMTLLTDVAVRAVKHTEYQKFWVHKRMRPEELGGRIEVQRNREPGRYDGMIHDAILSSPVLDRVESVYGSALLPLGYPEGSPVSSSYHAGHSAVAGACVTVLKAWFNESYVLPDPVVPSGDGKTLVPYTGPDWDRLTVGGELNKLAGNVAAGRAIPAVHYRSDNIEGIRLGEAVAIQLMREQKALYNEASNLTVTRFDGTTVTI